MNRRMYVIFLILFVTLYSGCTPTKFQRIGSPDYFMTIDKKATPLYGQPALYVNINVAGQNVASWFGPNSIVSSVAKGVDRKHNQAVVDDLIKKDFHDYTQTSIATTLSEMLSDVNRLQATDMLLLSSSPEEAKRQKESVSTTEIFAVDSHVAFYAGDVQNAFAVAFGAKEGIVTKLEIRFNYLSSGAERRKIWSDVFVCELEAIPFSESLVKDEAFRAKQLVKKALDQLQPWIKKELQSEPYDKYQRVRIIYRSGLKEEGWLLQDSETILAIRVTEGITRVIPKLYIREIKVI
jgi:hypothetical protein